VKGYKEVIMYVPDIAEEDCNMKDGDRAFQKRKTADIIIGIKRTLFLIRKRDYVSQLPITVTMYLR
jgi:hypothetical protein